MTREETLSGTHYELYQDSQGDWRWRLVHENGNILADSGQGYASKEGARKGIVSVRRNAGADVVDMTRGERDGE